jgi:hypothetical protein
MTALMPTRVACLILLSLLLAIACYRGAGQAGADDFRDERDAAAQQAEQDIKEGSLELRTMGLPAAWQDEYARLLGERLDVALVPVAGCLVTSRLVAEVDAYNSVMTAEIERRHGRGILDQLADEAQAVWEERKWQAAVEPATQPVAPSSPFQLRIGGDYDEAQSAFRSRGMAIIDHQRGFELARRRGRVPASFEVNIPGDRRVLIDGHADAAQRLEITALTLLENAARGESWVFRPLTSIDLDTWEFEEGPWPSGCSVSTSY